LLYEFEVSWFFLIQLLFHIKFFCMTTNCFIWIIRFRIQLNGKRYTIQSKSKKILISGLIGLQNRILYTTDAHLCSAVPFNYTVVSFCIWGITTPWKPSCSCCCHECSAKMITEQVWRRLGVGSCRSLHFRPVSSEISKFCEISNLL